MTSIAYSSVAVNVLSDALLGHYF